MSTREEIKRRKIKPYKMKIYIIFNHRKGKDIDTKG